MKNTPAFSPFRRSSTADALRSSAHFILGIVCLTAVVSGAFAQTLFTDVTSAPIHVAATGNDTTGTGEASAPFATLQKALEVSVAGDSILVGPGDYSGNFTISKADIAISSQQGPASTRITSAARDSVFFIAAEGAGAIIDGFTVSGGTGRPSPSSYGFDYYGGAINAHASAVIRNCILTGNGTGTPRVNSCTFGGAIYSAGRSEDVVLVENCVLANNFAWASGGATLTERSTIIFDRCTVWGNTSTDFFGNQGGLSAAWSGKIIVRNSILWGNGGSQLGAFSGIYASGTSGELHYSTIQGSVSGGGLASFAAGEGNLTSDPLLSAPAAGDFTLPANSPARDAGDPSAPRDPDGTRADMGYLATRFESRIAPLDTDGDGVNDYREIRDGTDPNDPESFNPLSKGLVACYPFDGNANDESGFQQTAGLRDTAAYVPRGAGSKKALRIVGEGFFFRENVAEMPALDKSNAGEFVEIPEPALGNRGVFTASIWVNEEGMSNEAGEAYITAGYAGDSLALVGNYHLYGGQSTLTTQRALTFESALYQDLASPVQLSEIQSFWMHYTVVSDGATISLYKNGERIHSGDCTAKPKGNWSIGRHWWDAGDTFSTRFIGSVSDFRVYSRALTEGEVQQLYTVEAAGLDSDGDGVTDYREQRDGTNPLDSSLFNLLSKNLIAHYPFNGNTLDESGYANNAVNRGALVSTDRSGGASGAYDFNGVDAYMDAPPLISDYQRNFTFSGWIRTAHVSSDRLDAAVSALCKTRDAGDFGGPAIDFREGKAVFTFNNNRVYGDLIPFEEWEYATPDLLADGNWRHYIMSIDANGLITAFINGQQVASHQISTFLEVTGASPFQIGRAGGAHEAARYFPGQIDEVRIYNRGLTAEEANMLYSESVCGLDSDSDGVTDYREQRDGTNPYDVASFEPLSVALIANYPFDNSWKDESGYCRDVLAPYTTFEPGLLGSSLGLAEGNSQASYWTDPGNINTPGRINTFTFSVWMKATTLEQADISSYYLISAPNNAAYLRIRNGTVGLHVLGMGHEWSGIPGYGYQTPETDLLRPMVWQHVVGVQEGEATRIYVNGQLVGSTDSGGEVPFDSANFTFGNLFNQNTFQGLLDEIRIYGRALSPAEVGALYTREIGDLDSDNDGLRDVHETNTGTFVSATDAGTDPYNPDTSGDGILDGEAVLWNFNPLTDHSQVLAFLRHATGVQSGRFGLFTEGSIMDLNLGGVMIQKSGSQASVRFKVQGKMDLRDAIWSDRGTYLLPPIDMPGSKGFLRIRAEQ